MNHKGKSNSNYKHGKYCKDYKNYCKCGKKLSPLAKTCGLCKIVSKKTKLKMSRNHADFRGKKNPMYGKTTHSKYIKYKNIFFHSTWEVAYAKYLDKKRAKWNYESIHFDLGNSTYTPDFYLMDEDKYIEIKGYWREDAKKKFKKFKRKYPNINIIILAKKDLEKIGVL